MKRFLYNQFFLAFLVFVVTSNEMNELSQQQILKRIRHYLE
jgi:hypothetical protein